MTDSTLRRYREATFQGSPKSLAVLGDELEALLPKERWVRDKDKESKWPHGFVFARAPDALPAASVFVYVDGHTGSVSNIVPLDTGQLSFDDYNGILTDFLDHGLVRAAPKLGLTVSATSANRPITDWLSEAAAKKLHTFSGLANKSTGAAHPSDRKRWLDFLVQAFRDDATIDFGTLRRWLIEIEHWPEEQADALAADYSFSRELLDFYSQQR
jgi:hypothetical protein